MINPVRGKGYVGGCGSKVVVKEIKQIQWNGPMSKLCQIWAEECELAIAIEGEFGSEKALSYLIGEKFLEFLDVSDNDPDFRSEIPAFVAEIKTIFEHRQLAQYFERWQKGPFDPNFENQFDICQSAARLLLVERATEWLLSEGE